MRFRFLEEDDDHHDEHEEEGHEEEGEGDSMVGVKILIMFIVLLAGCCVFIPYLPYFKDKEKLDLKSVTPIESKAKRGKMKCCRWRFSSFVNAFAAGLLISMAIIHILPESVEMYKTFLE